MTGRAANARRLYLHVLDGGSVTPRDMARLVETIEQLEATEEWLRIIGLRACEIGESWAISADDCEALEVIRAELTKQAPFRSDAISQITPDEWNSMDARDENPCAGNQANEGRADDNMAHHRVQPGQGKRL